MATGYKFDSKSFPIVFSWFFSELSSLAPELRAYQALKMRRWRAANPDRYDPKKKAAYDKNRRLERGEEIAARRKLRWAQNREKIAAERKVYRTANREKINAQVRAKKKRRYRADLPYKIKVILSTRIRSALKNASKAARTCALLGCDIPFLKKHLESRFKPGQKVLHVNYPAMTWENHGPVWQIDHIRPCASFDLTDPAQQKKCFHYSNLQPLFVLENKIKKDKIL